MTKIIKFDRPRPWFVATEPSKLPPGLFSLFLVIIAAFSGVVGYYLEDWISPPADPKPEVSSLIVGQAIVIDGDTIEIHGQPIQINGIDAPELDQTCTANNGDGVKCGVEAASFLNSFLQRSRPTSCKFVEWDQYGRIIGLCTRADGLDVAAGMVRSGNALDWPKYSNGSYKEYQEGAKADKLGMWAGQFVEPWKYREANRETASPNSPTERFSILPKPVPNRTIQKSKQTCAIKGNININTGQRIYHVPGQEFYAQTRINSRYGERWFCTEAEARAAGWRKARR